MELILYFAPSQGQQALHYELHKNISLQRRVTLSQADKIHESKEKIADLEKQLAEAQGMSPTDLPLVQISDFELTFV